MQRPILRKGDLVFVVSTGIISRLILWGQKTVGLDTTSVSHVAIVVDEDGALVEANPAGVELTNLYSRYCTPKHQVAIYRAINISELERELLAWEAKKRVGTRYGYPALLQQLIDRKVFGGRTVLRKLNLPFLEVCSETVAQVYSELGLNFGLGPGEAAPEEMLRFCKIHYAKYAPVLTLGSIEAMK